MCFEITRSTTKAKIELCVIRQIFDFKYSRSDKLCGPLRRFADKNGQIFAGTLAVSAQTFHGEFDSGSERTLAAWIRHASRTGLLLPQGRSNSVAKGCVTRGESAEMWGIARRKAN